jgi:hypothetical protein
MTDQEKPQPRLLSVTITGPEGMLEAMAKLLRDEGYTVTPPAGRALDRMPRFSLRKLAAAQRRVQQVYSDLSVVRAPVSEGDRRCPECGFSDCDPSFVHPFSAEQLAIITYALGVLSAERIAAGERLDEDPDAAVTNRGGVSP